LVKVVKERKGKLKQSESIVIYINTKARGEEVQILLGCEFYYRNISGERKKRKMVQRLVAGEIDMVIATNALGLSVDTPKIRYVMHIGRLRTLRDYVQESGRAAERDEMGRRARRL
jgi:superfamily II DNA helicase RecQ